MDQKPMGPVYLKGHASLKGRILFTNADPGTPDAAFIEQNDAPAEAINALAQQGYLIRTRADSDPKKRAVTTPHAATPYSRAERKSSARTTPAPRPLRPATR